MSVTVADGVVDWSVTWYVAVFEDSALGAYCVRACGAWSVCDHV